MKKLTFALALLATVATVQAQTTNQVLSRNAVGYQRFDLPKGSLTLIRPDFYPLDGGILKATNLFQRQLPANSRVFYYDAFGQFGVSPGQYAIDTMGALKFSTNITFTPGRSFWVQIPPTAASNNYTMYIMGEVPDSFNMGSSNKTITVPAGLSQLGIPYPVTTAFSNTHLGRISKVNDRVITWSGSNYVTYTRAALRWPTNMPPIQPGEGFFYVNANLNSTNWVEPKPYSWPN